MRSAEDDSKRAWALKALISGGFGEHEELRLRPQDAHPHLIREVLGEVLSIEDEKQRARCLDHLVTWVGKADLSPWPQAEQVLRELWAVLGRQTGLLQQRQWSRIGVYLATMVEQLAPHSTEGLLGDMLDVVRRMEDDELRAFALHSVIRHGNPSSAELLARFLAVAREINHAEARAMVLSDLAPRLAALPGPCSTPSGRKPCTGWPGVPSATCWATCGRCAPSSSPWEDSRLLSKSR